MRWRRGESPLTDAEMAEVEDLLPDIIRITQEQMSRFGVGEQYKRLILANGYAGAVDGVMQWRAKVRDGKNPSVPYPVFISEKIKLGVLEGIDNITQQGVRSHPVQSPPVAQRPGMGGPNGNQRHL